MRDYIIYNPKILGGKPVIKGTRISVDFVLELLASGMREDDIIKEYPQLTKTTIRAALGHAAHAMKREEVVFAR